MNSPLLTVVRSLNFQEDRREMLRDIPASAWPALLHLTDEARLTLALGIRCSSALPPGVRERVAESLTKNIERHARIVADWREIAEMLRGRGVEFIVLKGLTHWPYYADDPAHRPQYDFDLYCPPQSLAAARETIAALGYEPIAGCDPIRAGETTETDHLPSMIRKTGFQWTGDYFDPALPSPVEIHFRFWNSRREPFSVRKAERFWERRGIRRVGDLEIPSLDPIDGLSYATWHMMRHLVRGDPRLYHVYEIAHFLHRTCDHDSFWREWRDANDVEQSLAEPVAFRLAVEWFGCKVNRVVQNQIGQLPRKVNRWFELFAFSPVLAQERLNKDEIFLHLALVPGFRSKLRIAAGRVFPLNPPRVVLDAHRPDAPPALRARRVVFRTAFLARRAWRHVRALSPVLRSALRWWRP